MARIKIELPEHFSFSTTLAVRITDLNYGGHVGNDSVLSLLHEARVQFLHQAGFTELDAGGIGLIMSDAALEFKNELFYGDLLTVSIALGEFSKVGFDIFYKLEKKLHDSQLPVAYARTGMVCYDYGLKKIAAVPVQLRSRLLAIGEQAGSRSSSFPPPE